MLLKGYRKEIFRPKCNPSFQSILCIAHLDQDVSEALPYLNMVLGEFEYLKGPPAVTFRVHGNIITVHPREIAVNALKNEEEADKILEILKLLPKTNCRECGEPTCMVFATRVSECAKGTEDFPALME